MPYTPTGKPPGRPRKDGQPAGAKPEVKQADEAKPEAKPEVKQAELAKPPAMRIPPGPLMPAICSDCYPDGWPEGWSGTGCAHGIWTRRI